LGLVDFSPPLVGVAGPVGGFAAGSVGPVSGLAGRVSAGVVCDGVGVEWFPCVRRYAVPPMAARTTVMTAPTAVLTLLPRAPAADV
jgi:hypothetical protein